MLLDDHVVSTTTGSDIEEMKVKLFYQHFHLPLPGAIKPKRKKKRKA